MPLQKIKIYGDRLLNYCAFYDSLMDINDIIRRGCDTKDCTFYLIVSIEELVAIRNLYKRKEFRRTYQQREEDIPRLKI